MAVESNPPLLLAFAASCERRGQLRPTIESISAFPGFDLDELFREVVAFGRRKPLDRLTLGLDAEA